ncbi:MAG: hypothetical protein RL701_4870 [Pseudomonadota bacterium]
MLRFIKAGMLMTLITFIVIPTMIVKGLLFGPLGSEGWLSAPLILLTSWAAILYWAFAPLRSKLPPPPSVAKAAGIAQLPASTDAWLEEQRRFLPQQTHSQLDSIGMRLEALSTQLQNATNDRPQAQELRRLLGEELPELVSGYRKVPRELQQKAMHGGSSPERQLIEGLTTIDEQIGRMHEQLASDDLQALATHQRYLDLKYKREDELK